MMSLSRHTDFLCELLTSLLIRGMQIWEMSKLGWLIGIITHATWTEIVFPTPAVTFKSQNPSFNPAYSMILFIDMFG
jgi:hypothetical protein